LVFLGEGHGRLPSDRRDPDSFEDLIAELEGSVRARCGNEISCAALMDDPVADALWAASGYVREGERRVKMLSGP
jgi:hypothetical protein